MASAKASARAGGQPGTFAHGKEADQVRVGVDLLGAPAAGPCLGDVGRYTRALVAGLLAAGSTCEVVLYVPDPESERDDGRESEAPATAASLPPEVAPLVLPGLDRALVRTLALDPARRERTREQRIDRLARENPDALDWLVVPDPFTFVNHYGPPTRPLGGLRVAACVHDLAAFQSQGSGLLDPLVRRRYRSLELLRTYDLLLGSTEAVCNSARAILGLEPGRVQAVGMAACVQADGPEASRSLLARLGITRRFVWCHAPAVAWAELMEVLDAFGRLPKAMRTRHQFVFSAGGGIGRGDLDALCATAGVPGSFWVAPGVIDEPILAALGSQCAAFVNAARTDAFPQLLAEVMRLGAAVVAGNTSAQNELVGDAGLVANAGDPIELGDALGRLLDLPDDARRLGQRARERAAAWDGGAVAARVLEAMQSHGGSSEPRRSRRPSTPHSTHKRGPLPRLAFFSPLPPKKSGVADYSGELLGELARHYTIDLFHETDYVPELALHDDRFAACDARLFPRLAAEQQYRGVVYQMGNSNYHEYLYPTLLRYPGIVTLHDFCLAGFHLFHGMRMGQEREYIAQELLHWYPDDAEKLAATLEHWRRHWDWRGVARDCAKNGWYLNRRLLAAAERMVVHSPWCSRQVAATMPADARRVAVIPMGIRPRVCSDAARAETRARFGLAPDALVLASFGFMGLDKLVVEAAQAFEAVAQACPHAVYLLVGEDADLGHTRRLVMATAASDRVRFLGRQSQDDFDALMAATDLGINLRRPPTNGETSAALLNLLAFGVPTVVTDVDTFADLPGSVVRKVPWDENGPNALRAALLELATSPQARKRLGQAALAHIQTQHSWPHVAQMYVDVIEQAHEERSRRQGTAAGPRAAERPARLAG